MDLPKTLYDLPRSLLGPHEWLARQPRDCSGSIAERLGRLEAELAARDLVNAYTYFYDGKDIDGLMTLYTADCVLVNPRGTYVGSEAIRANYEHLKAGTELVFHHANNVRVSVTPGSAEAWVSAYLYAVSVRGAGSRVATMGTYVFHLAKRGDDWKVVECRITDDGRHSFGPPPEPSPTPPPKATRPQTSRDLIRG